MFSTNDANTNASASFLDRPYLGKARLVSVENPIFKTKNGDQMVLRFTFELGGNPEMGVAKHTMFSHTMFEPKPLPTDTNEKFREKLLNRLSVLAYMSKYWIGEEEAKKFTGATWEEFCRSVVTAFYDENKQLINGDKIVLIKVLGSVYNNKPNLGFPNYRGFISDDESQAPVTLTRDDIINNEQFMNFRPANASPSDSPTPNFANEAKPTAF